MTEKQIEDRMAELKMDYIQIQNDLEKLESVGKNITPAEKRLKDIEDELNDLKKELSTKK